MKQKIPSYMYSIKMILSHDFVIFIKIITIQETLFHIETWIRYHSVELNHAVGPGHTDICNCSLHDEVIKWDIFRITGPLFEEFTVEFPHKGRWRRALIFSLMCVWINGWVNNREADDLRRHRTHYDVTLMCALTCPCLTDVYHLILFGWVHSMFHVVSYC